MELVKNEGNEFFRNNDFEKALEKYKEALDLTKESEDLSKLHSNISATFCKLDNYELALEHAIISTKLDLDWYKGWYRLSIVLFNLNKIEPAKKAIDRTIECCSDKGIDDQYIFDLKKKIFGEKVTNYNVINNEHNNLNMNPLMNKMMGNDKIREKMLDPNFREKMLKNKSNPLSMLNDPEMLGLMNEVMNFK